MILEVISNLDGSVILICYGVDVNVVNLVLLNLLKHSLTGQNALGM